MKRYGAFGIAHGGNLKGMKGMDAMKIVSIILFE